MVKKQFPYTSISQLIAVLFPVRKLSGKRETNGMKTPKNLTNVSVNCLLFYTKEIEVPHKYFYNV